MDQVAPAPERRSWRVPAFAIRHSLSRSMVYKEIAAGRLPARKAGSATIITAEDEATWLASLPRMSPSEAA